jgi:hypothetical protein
VLLKYGAKPSKPDPDGKIPLAAAARNPEIFQMLVDRGADTNADTTEQKISSSDDDIVESKSRLINFLCEKGFSDSLRILLSRKVPFEERDSNGLTPLQTAVSCGQTEVAQILIDSGADIRSKTLSGKSVADLAADALDISLLRKLDSNEKYKGILTEYYPPAESQILGDWYSDDQLVVELRSDGGGRFIFESYSHSLAWKAMGHRYEIATFLLLHSLEVVRFTPTRFVATYDPKRKQLSLVSNDEFGVTRFDLVRKSSASK